MKFLKPTTLLLLSLAAPAVKADIALTEDQSKVLVDAEKDLQWGELFDAVVEPFEFWKNESERHEIFNRRVIIYKCPIDLATPVDCRKYAKSTGQVEEVSLIDVRERIEAYKERVDAQFDNRIVEIQNRYKTTISNVNSQIDKLQGKKEKFDDVVEDLRADLSTLNVIEQDVEREYQEYNERVLVMEQETSDNNQQFVDQISEAEMNLAAIIENISERRSATKVEITELKNFVIEMSDEMAERVGTLDARRNQMLEAKDFERTVAYKIFKQAKGNKLYLGTAYDLPEGDHYVESTIYKILAK